MLDRMMNQEANPRNPRNEPERRKEERRREDRRPEEEKRREQRRENVQMMDSRPMRQNETGMTPDSLPRNDKDPGTRNPETWEAENFQTGTSQAQKAQGWTPEQQTVPAERHERKGPERKGEEPNGEEQRGEGVAGLSTSGPGQSFGPGGRAHSFGGDGSQRDRQKNDGDEKRHTTDFGESHDRPLGRGDAGGKIDSTQRDFGQTGQNMKGGGQVHSQQGPYGPPAKHRGPQAPGKPLMDDWGKSDKH